MLFDEWDDRQSQTQARANAAVAASTTSTSRGMVRNSSMTHAGYSSEEDEKLPPAPRQNRAQTGDHGSDSDGEGPHKPSATTEAHEYGDGEEDAPAMFHVEKLDWRPTREQGSLVDLSVASNVLVIATSANYLIRWNLDVDEFDEIQISKRQDDSIHRVAIDPTGSHILVSLESGNNFYIHAKWTKPHQLTKIKGLVIESVAWNNAQGTVDSTKRILLGTTKGLIFECQMDEKQHDKYAKKVYDLNEPDAKETTPISGLYMEHFPSSESDAPKYFVMAATPTRQYQFIGGPTFDAMFLKYQSNPAFLELPGTLGYSELRFFSPNMKQDKTAVAETCAWLSGPGIYYGKLVFGSQDQPGDKVVEDGSLLAYPAYPGSGPSSAVIPPLSLILTRFHFLLLNKNRLVAINQLSEEIVFEDVFNTQQMGTMIRFAHDMRKDTIWLLSDKCVYEVEIISEDREVWKLYLAEGRFADALEYCDTPYQEEQVMNAQADHTFAQGAYELSASIYAKTQRSFEEVTLKFVNIGLTHPEAKSALKTYLSAKLDTLSPQDLTQQTMICTWLTEIYLDNLNHLQDPPMDDDHLYPTDPSIPQLSDEERKEKREQEHREFREFLDHYFDCLNKETTFELISSHGRVDDLLFYARIIGDLEWILNHHCEQHEYDEALEVLATHKDHVKNAEIYYKFTPTLLQHRPKETVDMLIQMKGLDPSKLIPALMRYDASRTVDTTTSADGETSNQAIRYLEHVIKQRNKDPAIHNYLVSLYAKQADDVPLLRFIEAHKSKPIFDYKYALRLCHQEKKLRACVGIYTAMELYEEAVELSLQVDVNVAKRVVAQASTRITPQQRRRLWLIIARHVIETEQHVTKALEILKESELKFEDLLPYFPDFVRIGEFKEEICNSLDSYNRSIEQLKSEMDEYTNSAEMIRKDISELRNRFGIVTSSQRCDLCSQPVLTRPFYLFPCTHVFHIDCMISHVTEYLEKNPQLKAQVLAGLDEKDASTHPTLPASNSHSSIPSSTTLTSSNSQPQPQPSPSTSSSATTSLLNRMESVLSDKERERERAERERIRLAAQEKLIRQQKAMESFASSECLFCGQMMIDSVHNPFIELPAEKEEVASWQI